MLPDEPTPGVTRRSVVRTGANLAWMVPAITLVTEAPALATSTASLIWVGSAAGAWAGATNVSVLGVPLLSQKTAPFNLTSITLKNAATSESVAAGSLKITVTLSAFQWYSVAGLLGGAENFNTPTVASPWTVTATPISGQTGSLQFVFTYANAIPAGGSVTMPNLAFTPSGANLLALLANPKETAQIAVSQATASGSIPFTLPAPQSVTSTN